MQVLLFGAGGAIGSAIAAELLARGHHVTGACPSGVIPDAPDGMTVRAGDATDADSVAGLASGKDAVASAVGPSPGTPDDMTVVLGATSALIEGVRRAGVGRLVLLGDSGSLFVGPGRRAMDEPDFPPERRRNAEGHVRAQRLLEWADDIDWTYISPPASVEPGVRTGTYRIEGDDLPVAVDGPSHITLPDYAVAFADQLEDPTIIGTCMTVFA
jgi:putative NADH-flavin reductase